ncbi:MAG: hypothetical protein GY811_28105 [Myxococcales bacterium]|nr:hypothetical protein [Myxococcales bacterium]
MPIRHFILFAAVLLGLATFAGACGDHRAEEFCTNLCECTAGQSEQEQAACVSGCTDGINQSDEESGDRIVSNECFSCVSQTTCERLETSCSADCESAIDFRANTEQPIPRPGDQ